MERYDPTRSATAGSTAEPPQPVETSTSCLPHCIQDLFDVIWSIVKFIFCCGSSDTPHRGDSSFGSRRVEPQLPPPPGRVEATAEFRGNLDREQHEPISSFFRGRAGQQGLNLEHHGQLAVHNSESFRLPQMPLTGVYNGRGGYDFADNMTYLRVPRECLVAFPAGIRERFADADNVELYIDLADDKMQGDLRNVVAHPLVDPDCMPGTRYETNKRFQMGLFEPTNVTTLGCPSPVPVDRFAPVIVSAHGMGLSMSPDNAQFAYRRNTRVASYFTAVDMRDAPILPHDRCVAVFHLSFRRGGRDYRIMNDILRTSRSVSGALQAVRELFSEFSLGGKVAVNRLLSLFPE